MAVEFFSSQPSETIASALIGLDQVAQQVNKRVVILMDEFQQISSIADYHSIEAGIRHAVECSKNVSYIFSGSDRHILEQMFNDKSRPLYKLCKLIRVERIHAEDLAEFIKEASEQKWGSQLSTETVDTILKNNPF